jgi:anti-anti-sigma regulatory factor
MQAQDAPTTLTRTIFVYDKDEQRRRAVLNHFANHGSYRVLCLDFLVQTKKKANEIKPHAILCSPHGEHVTILKTMAVLGREWETRRIPFYLYDTVLTEMQKQVYIKHGIRNFFTPHASLQDIFRGVQSGASYSKFVSKSELIQKEEILPSGAQYFYLQVLSAGMSDLKKLLRKLSDIEMSIEWSDICLDLTRIDTLDTECVEMITSFISSASQEGIHVSLISISAMFQQHLKSVGVNHFESMPEFLDKSVSLSHGMASSSMDLHDLEVIPDAGKIDEINDLDDLDALLDSIPDFD